MRRAGLTRLIRFAAAGMLLAATFSSCIWILQKAQVRFDNQSTDTITSITLGTASLFDLKPGATSPYYVLDPGTYTLETVSSIASRTWPVDLTLEKYDSYTVIFFGTESNLGAEYSRD